MQQPSKPLWLATASLALVVGMGAFSSAAAQNYPKAAVGYQFVHSGATGTNLSFPAGWFVDVSLPIDLPGLTLLVSADGSYRSEANLHTYLAGARYTLEPRGKITPFAQALVGISRFSITSVDVNASDTRSVMDAGAGINYEVNNRWTFRLGADYRRRTSDPAANQLRVNLGVIFGIGG